MYALIRPKRISVGTPSQCILGEIINTALSKMIELLISLNKKLVMYKKFFTTGFHVAG